MNKGTIRKNLHEGVASVTNILLSVMETYVLEDECEIEPVVEEHVEEVPIQQYPPGFFSGL